MILDEVLEAASELSSGDCDLIVFDFDLSEIDSFEVIGQDGMDEV